MESFWKGSPRMFHQKIFLQTVLTNSVSLKSSGKIVVMFLLYIITVRYIIIYGIKKLRLYNKVLYKTGFYFFLKWFPCFSKGLFAILKKIIIIFWDSLINLFFKLELKCLNSLNNPSNLVNFLSYWQ